MNVELVAPGKLKEANALIKKGGEHILEGVAELLVAKADYAAAAATSAGAEQGPSEGTSCSEALNAALKRLQDDPYLALGLSVGNNGTSSSGGGGSSVADSDVKKSYRRCALKYHPDKTQNKTGLLFTIVQAAYVLLSDPEKKAAHDARVIRQAEKLEQLRRRKTEAEARKTVRQKQQQNSSNSNNESKEAGSSGGNSSSSGGGNMRPPPVSTNSFRQPPQSEDEATYRAFNKRFYEEFRRRVRNPESNGSGRPPPPRDGRPPPPATPKPDRDGSSSSSGGSSGAGKSSSGGGGREGSTRSSGGKAAPARPGSLRSSIRTDTAVTLAWDARGADEKATAYELQWRAKGGSRTGDNNNKSGHDRNNGNSNSAASAWETSNQLILGTTCRKKNLTPQTCYEFRVRAASAFGWSGYAEPLLVVTLPVDSTGRSAAEQETAAKAARAKVAERGRQQSPAKENNNSKNNGGSSGSGSGSGSGAGRGSIKEPRPPSQSLQPTARMTGAGWQCVVCKRPNERGQGQCRTCFTKRSYIANKLNGIRSKEEKGGYHTDGPSTSKGSSNGGRNDRGYASAADGSSRRHRDGEGFGSDDDEEEEEEEYGDSAWAYDEAKDVFESGEPDQPLQVGDLVLTGGLSSAEYNGFVGEVKSGLIDGRYQVELRLKNHVRKDLRLKPANLRLKRSNPSSKSREAFSEPTPGSTTADNGGASSSSSSTGGSGFPRLYWLNGSTTRLHNVRSEPIKESSVVGHLVEDKQVMALAEAGDWLKVEWHYPPDSSSSSSANPKGGSLHSPTGPSTGWCLARDADHRIEFLVEDHPSDVGGAGAGVGDEGAQHHGQEWGEEEERGEGSGSDEIEELIYELRDEAGDLYYFNSATGVSSWEPPEWIDSVDPSSGACYYENTLTGTTQWELPFDFVPVVREEAYSTPDAEFVKNILSPKRSRGPSNFFSPDQL